MSRGSIKRVLKPVIEKKRRDRINQRLDELRTILLSNTSDMRLKNPKLEKAEILELTVDYIRRKPHENHNKDSPAPMTTATSHKAANSAPIAKPAQAPHNPIYSAGFQECVARLENFIESVEPSQRESFVQGLKNHLDGHSSCPSGRTQSQSFPVDVQPWGPAAEGPYRFGLHNRTESSLLGHYRGGRESSFPFSNTSVSVFPKSFVLHHHARPAQTATHPYPSPAYSLSPPPSPCYSPAFTTTPPYLSLPCHFPFPPSPSQFSPDTLSSSPPSTSTPEVAVMAAHPPLVCSPPTPLRPSVPVSDEPSRTLRRSLFQIQPQAAWRPWA